MKEKREQISFLFVIIVFIFIIVLFSTQVLAQSSEDQKISDAYSCLKDKLTQSCTSQTTEQSALSLLALSGDSTIQTQCLSNLNSKKKTNCFGESSSGSCDIKSTSQAIIALDNIEQNTTDLINWILTNKKSVPDLDWYLEIDTNIESTCTIDSSSFVINADKTITGSSTCLEPAIGNYFLKINPSCHDKSFEVSCNQGFITTLLYQKSGDTNNIIHVSSETHSASASESTKEKINSFCFGPSNCDYEDSLWAALALGKTGNYQGQVNDLLPYLTTVDEDNPKFLPSSFLYMLTNLDEFYTELVRKQKSGNHWEATGSDNGKFYDTALSIWALDKGLNTNVIEKSKEYLLDEQGNSGCWNNDNVRDTAFVLYSSWPDEPIIPPGSPGTGGSGTGGTNGTNGTGGSGTGGTNGTNGTGGSGTGGTGGLTKCVDSNYYCVSPSECLGEDTLDNYYCNYGVRVCCSVQPAEISCTDKGGKECTSSQRCSGVEVTSSDTNFCCLDSCLVGSSGGTGISDDTSDCEVSGYSCQSSCSSDQEEKRSYSCTLGDICCSDINENSEKSLLWLWLLIILIVLMVLAIIFRNQLKVWIFRSKSGFKSKSAGYSKRPSFPPSSGQRHLYRPRPITSRGHVQNRPRPPSVKRTEKDSVFDETMKKLKEMTK